MQKEIDIDSLVLNVRDDEPTFVKTIVKQGTTEIPAKTIDGESYIRTLHRVEFISNDDMRYVIMLKNAKMSEFIKLYKKAKESDGEFLCILAKSETDPKKRRFESRRFEVREI